MITKTSLNCDCLQMLRSRDDKMKSAECRDVFCDLAMLFASPITYFVHKSVPTCEQSEVYFYVNVGKNLSLNKFK